MEKWERRQFHSKMLQHDPSELTDTGSAAHVQILKYMMQFHLNEQTDGYFLLCFDLLLNERTHFQFWHSSEKLIWRKVWSVDAVVKRGRWDGAIAGVK